MSENNVNLQAEETEKADAPKDVKMNLFNDEGGNE